MRRVPRLLALSALTAAALLAIVRRGRSRAESTRGRGTTDFDTLYQTSTLGALIDGLYQPATDVGKLKKQGDIGVGAFGALDGEMVVLDGVVYQVKADGAVDEPGDSTGVSYATVTEFESDRSFELTGPMEFEEFKRKLDSALGEINQIHVFRIEGHFDHVRTRSVPKQSEPYPPLAEITAEQPEFEFDDTDGVIVAIWFPSMLAQLDPPGYHMHFLTAARDGGGHLLDARPSSVRVQIDDTPEFGLSIPRTPEFRQADLGGDYAKRTQAVER